MAEFEVTSPDGAKYRITAPDNASDADVSAFVQKHVIGDQKQKSEPYKDWSSYGKDLARTTFQGPTLGFGEEATATVRSMLEGGSRSDKLAEERAALKRFSDQNPGTALTAELAGGLLMPGGAAAGRFVARGANLLRQSGRSAAVGAGIGGTAAIGNVEGNDYQAYKDALTSGGATGAAIGAVLPPAIAGAQRAWQGARSTALARSDSEASARLYLADKLRQNGTTEQAAIDDLARGQQSRQFTQGTAELPEMIADTSPGAQRALRGIKVGGGADAEIEGALGRRQSGVIDYAKGAETGGQLDRLTESTRLAMRATEQDLADQTAMLSGRRNKEAKILFDDARKQSQPIDLSPTLQRYSFEAMNLMDPKQRSTLNRAISYFDGNGQSRGKNPVLPVIDVDRFHKGKMALDDMLGNKDLKSQGNLYRLLTSMKHDLMGEVLPKNPAYKLALDKYSSKSALLNAADLGRAFAKGSEPITDKMWRGMPEGEKAMVRKAYAENMSRSQGGKPAGPTSDFTGPFRSQNVQEDFRMMLPPGAGKSSSFPGGNREMLGELVGREHRMSDTARKVLGNSSTAEKAADAIDISKLGRVSRYLKDSGGLFQAGVSAVSDAVEKMTAIKGDKARYLAQKLLSTDPLEQMAFLRQVANEHGAHQTPKIMAAIDRATNRIEQSILSKAGREEGGDASQRAKLRARNANMPRGLIGLGNATR